MAGGIEIIFRELRDKLKNWGQAAWKFSEAYWGLGRISRIQFLLQMNAGVRKVQQDPFVKGQGCGVRLLLFLFRAGVFFVFSYGTDGEGRKYLRPLLLLNAMIAKCVQTSSYGSKKICTRKRCVQPKSVGIYMLSLRGLHIPIPLTVLFRRAVLKFFEHGTEIVAGGKPEGICQICDANVGF